MGCYPQFKCPKKGAADIDATADGSGYLDGFGNSMTTDNLNATFA
jgi:hypothetical protein